jgi:hypothetical protein
LRTLHAPERQAMGTKLIAALPWLVEIAKKKEFPDSVFAVESIADIFWGIAKDNNSDDPESCDVVTAQCEELGMSYSDILELSTQTLSTELNSRIEKGKDFVGDLVYGLAMIAATELNDTNSEVIYVDWSMWEGYDPADMVRLPDERLHLLPDIPYAIFSQLVNAYSRNAGMSLDSLLSEVPFRMKQIFERDKDKFVIQKLTTPVT